MDRDRIENMNTVLDDNKKLCLNSGEIIKLTPVMTMMFEACSPYPSLPPLSLSSSPGLQVQDLAVASPATVSRCGMVYMEPRQLGWRPVIRSLVEASAVLRPHAAVVLALSEWLLDPALYYLRRHCAESVPTGDTQQAVSVLRLLEAFCAHVAADSRFATHEQLASLSLQLGAADAPPALDAGFLYALAWGVGGALDDAARAQLDGFVRRLVAGDLGPTDVPPGTDPKAKSPHARNLGMTERCFRQVSR
jgi:dynein heavy chain